MKGKLEDRIFKIESAQEINLKRRLFLSQEVNTLKGKISSLRNKLDNHTSFVNIRATITTLKSTIYSIKLGFYLNLIGIKVFGSCCFPSMPSKWYELPLTSSKIVMPQCPRIITSSFWPLLESLSRFQLKSRILSFSIRYGT